MTREKLLDKAYKAKDKKAKGVYLLLGTDELSELISQIKIYRKEQR